MMKKHSGFIIFFAAVIIIFLGKLVFMKAAFLDGDYLVQFYPWSKLYSQAIKSFQLPFWTEYFHCGFPLMAEGQIGGFYPLNIAVFFALPFKIAYNYSAILHFILAGVFTYFYTRKMGADEWGGSLAALVFCFGSAYAGCFYNTACLKTLSWCPLVFFLFERYFESRKTVFILSSAIIYGAQLLAGYTQIALYCGIFYLVYFIHGALMGGKFKLRDAVRIILFLFIAGVIFLPQFLLTWQLASFSSRQTASMGFALWGSFSPFNIVSVCIPYWVFHGTRFYLGVLSLFFILLSFLYFKKDLKIRRLIIMLAFSFFLALGFYNPLNMILLKVTHLYALRNPSKFILFGAFSASVLAGIGFTRFFASSNEKLNKRSARMTIIFILAMLGLFFLSKVVLCLAGGAIISAGRWLVSNYVAGKSYHIYDLADYLSKADNFYRQLVDRSYLSNPFIIASLALCLAVIVFCIFVNRYGRMKPLFKYIIFAALIADLYLFSFYATGLRGNIKSFEWLEPSYKRILGIIKEDKTAFRILPFGLKNTDGIFWAMPNTNSLEGIDSVAAYTPLVSDAYRQALLPLQAVDNSLGMRPPADDALGKAESLLKLMNVKYIISKRDLSGSYIEKVGSEGDTFLYELKDRRPEIFFTRSLEDEMSAMDDAHIAIIERRDGFIEAEFEASRKGYIIFSEYYYPGWRAFVDTEEKTVVSVKGMLQGVYIDTPGRHRVSFIYSPYTFLVKR